MTSRLKRKLNDLGVDPSSSKANESFCLIGTPLPPLEKSKDTGEFVPLWKQEVRDEKGRRRLHGAFTGGFSAGYFNSVGSKEGWAPTTFVSSRSDRAKNKQARPEDFMDEEDLAEIRESRQLIDENDEMDFGGTEAELRKRNGELEDDTMANALAASLDPSTSDSVGARILKKMGWRVGQGIGPRITYAQKVVQDKERGIRMYQDDKEGEDEEAKKHMYPRRDTPLLLVQRKDNSHGLGYTPGMGLNESLGRGGGGDGERGLKLSAGFGLGALNDADEDDLDVYDGALQAGSRSGRVAFDAEDDEDQIAMGSSRRAGHSSQKSVPAGTMQTFRDGRPVLKGFVLSDQPVAEDRWFPLPEVPKGWRPNPRRVWDAEKNKENLSDGQGKGKGRAETQPPKTHAEWKNSLLSADERGSMLGETPLPPQARSVFDYMSQKDRERLEKLKNNLTSGAPRAPSPSSFSQPPVPSSTPSDSVVIPDLHPSVAKAALSGFQPFTADPLKHSRYTIFLQYASDPAGSGSGKGLGIGPMPGQSMDEFNKELSDYGKAATVFKPLSGAMAGRFRSAIVVEHGPKVIEGLHTPDVSNPPDEDEKEEKKEDEDPRMGAVRLGMYGPLTREMKPWQPAKLLCKRFGVKEPEMNADDLAELNAGHTSKFDEAFPPPAPEKPPPDSATGSGSATPLAITDGSATETGEKSKRNMASIGLGEDETQGQDTLTYKRPAMDIFKAIFASDDEDSDDDEAPPIAVTQPDANGQPHERSPSATVAAPPEQIQVDVDAVNPPPPVPVFSMPNEIKEKVDLATFKPTFVPRSERDSRKDKDKEKGKDGKKKKDKKAKTTILSFDDEDEGGLHVNVAALKAEKRKKDKDKDKDHERKKKKQRKEETQTKDEDDDDSMWLEKPTPEVVQNIDFNNDDYLEHPPDSGLAGAAGPSKGRKRAIDFM